MLSFKLYYRNNYLLGFRSMEDAMEYVAESFVGSELDDVVLVGDKPYGVTEDFQPEIKPSPGSDEAISLGCTCPVLDNGRGRGFILGDQQVFWIAGDCPVHASKQ